MKQKGVDVSDWGSNHAPKGYVWHHIDNEMVLVNQGVHNTNLGGFSHAGGMALDRALNGIKPYNVPIPDVDEL